MIREEQMVSAQRRAMSPQDQHIEFGIAENNLFLLLAALGLSIGTEAILAAARACLVVLLPTG